MEKKELRKLSKELRKSINIKEISEAIASKIENSCEFQKSKNVLLFYPKEYEINLISLSEKYKKEKNFYLPRVCNENLLVCPYDCFTNMKISEFEIKEPCSAPVSPLIINYAIVPCLCADRKGYRIGYGGGFYDRFIPLLNKDCIKICPVPSDLIYENIETEALDVPVNFIITEKNIISCDNYC